jgi:hypothetical protein
VSWRSVNHRLAVAARAKWCAKQTPKARQPGTYTYHLRLENAWNNLSRQIRERLAENEHRCPSYDVAVQRIRAFVSEKRAAEAVG